MLNVTWANLASWAPAQFCQWEVLACFGFPSLLLLLSVALAGKCGLLLDRARDDSSRGIRLPVTADSRSSNVTVAPGVLLSSSRCRGSVLRTQDQQFPSLCGSSLESSSSFPPVLTLGNTIPSLLLLSSQYLPQPIHCSKHTVFEIPTAVSAWTLTAPASFCNSCWQHSGRCALPCCQALQHSGDSG